MKKKVFILLLAALMVLGVSPIYAHDKVTYAEWGTPVVDGVKEDVWDAAQSIYVADEAIEDVGDETSTAYVYSLWDGDYIYFYAVITDPTVDAVLQDDAWNQDAIGFMIDYSYNREFEVNYRDLGDASYAGYVNVPAVAGTANYPESPTIFGIAKYADNVSSYCKITDTGWEVEIAIPLAYKVYQPGDKIGYEICVNNSIGEGDRASQCVWDNDNGNGGTNAWQYTSAFGTLIFNEKPAEETAAPETEAPAAADTAVETPAAQTSDAAAIAIAAFVGAAYILYTAKKKH